MGVTHEIQVIGNPRNAKKQKVLVGNLGFYSSALKIGILFSPVVKEIEFYCSGIHIYIYIYLKGYALCRRPRLASRGRHLGALVSPF